MAQKNKLVTQNTKRKKILVLTSTFPRWEGDAEPPFVYELCRRLNANYSMHILAPHAPGAAEQENFDGIPVTRYRYFIQRWETLAYHGGILANLKQKRWRYGLIPFFLLGQFIALIRLLCQCHYDCIHAHWLIPQGLIALTARLFKKSCPPVIVTSHGGDLYALKGFVFNRIKRYVARQSAAVTVVSQAMKKKLNELIPGEDRVQVIPMGVDLHNRFVPPAKRQATGVVLFVGRLVEKKGLHYLIEAMPAILEQHPQAMLRIVGDGQEKERAKKRIVELNIGERAVFIGAVGNDELPAIYQSADVVVFPSVIADDGDREGFGLVLVEALGCECATVVSDLPAMRDIIRNGHSAIVVPEKDPAQLAAKITQLLDDIELRQNLGRQGRGEVLEKFDWQVITRQYSNLIRSITK
jgi:glycosyltransferase involved in cell wall biosynthesis